MSIEITSTANPRVKETLRLEKRAERDQRRLMLVEGVREVQRALAAGVLPKEAFVCRELLVETEELALFQKLQTLDRQGATQLYLVSAPVFARLAVREQSGGILVVAPYLERTLAETRLSANPFVAVVEGAEKPGNLGAILRSADGAGVELVIVTGGGADIHNPNVVRASLGARFTVPLVECPAAEAIAWLRRQHIAIIAASPDADIIYTKIDMRGPVALVLGSEAWGLGDVWRSSADRLASIPMAGVIDSLNLATSAALLFYEVVRQRRY